MNTLRKRVGIALVLVVGMLAYGMANAVVLNFDQFDANGEVVHSYYNGGCTQSYNSGPTHCSGPNYGITWSNTAVAGAATPTGLFNTTANEPSASNVLGFVSGGTGATFHMDDSTGFYGGFSFWYSAPFQGGDIEIWSGVSGTGTLLASLHLNPTGTSCAEFVPNVWASCWATVGLNFNGIAKSIVFSGNASQMVFDNMSLGTNFAVPEPAVLGIFGLGLLLLGGFVTLRRRRSPQV